MKVYRHRITLVREETRSFMFDGQTHLSDPEQVVNVFRLLDLDNSPQEQVSCFYLDTRNHPVGWAIVFRGGADRAAVEPKAIFQMAMELNASGIIMAHNHPSGDPSPSAEDLAMTHRIRDAGNILGTRLVDHLIIGDRDRTPAWVSLRQRGDFNG